LLSPGQHGEVLQRLRQRESVVYLPAQDQAFLTSPEEETWSSKLFGGPGARFDGTRMLQLDGCHIKRAEGASRGESTC